MCKLRKVRAIWRTSKEHKTSQHTDARGESWHDAAANVTWRWPDDYADHDDDDYADNDGLCIMISKQR